MESSVKEQVDRDIALITIADLYLYYFRRDHAFKSMLEDPRAKEITEDQVVDLWQPNTANLDEAWSLKGLGCISLASIHYWKNSIDFCYLDVGAHVGLTTIAQAIFCKRCGFSNLIYAFEPGEVFFLLQRAIKINRVPDLVSCIQAAASDETGLANFYLTPAQSPASSLLKCAVDRPVVVERVPTVTNILTIDEFLRGKNPTAGVVAKIDAEGADFLVLDGMKKTLSECLCTMQIEFSPALVDSYADPAERLLALAKNFILIEVGPAQPHLIVEEQHSIDDFTTRVRELLPQAVTDIFLIPKKLPQADKLIDRLRAGS